MKSPNGGGAALCSAQEEPDAVQELADLVVEEMAEDDIITEFIEGLVDCWSLRVQDKLDREREQRNRDKDEEERLRLERKKELSKQKSSLVIKTDDGSTSCHLDPDRKSPGQLLREAAERYVGQVENMKKELLDLRSHRDSIIQEISELSTEVQEQKAKASKAQDELAEGERQLEQARLDMFLSLQNLGCEVLISTIGNGGLPDIKEGSEGDEAGVAEETHSETALVSPIQHLATTLSSEHHFYVDGFSGVKVMERVRNEVLSLKDSQMLRPGLVAGGRVGSGEKVINNDIRSDLMAFYSAGNLSYYDSYDKGSSVGEQVSAAASERNIINSGGEVKVSMPATDSLLREIDAFIQALGPQVPELKQKNTVLLRSKAMLTYYPEHGKYTRHIDDPNANGRILTVIYYLNTNYDASQHGGELRLHLSSAANTDMSKDIWPIANRLLVFWSDKRVPHQVLPSKTDRFAVTVWYSDAREQMHALEDSAKA